MSNFFINGYQVSTVDGRKALYPVSRTRYDAATKKFQVYAYGIDYPDGCLHDVKGEDVISAMIDDKFVLNTTKTLATAATLVRGTIGTYTRIDPSEVSDSLEEGLYYTSSHSFTGTKAPEIKAELKAIIAEG